jgi:hypothetical protein
MKNTGRNFADRGCGRRLLGRPMSWKGNKVSQEERHQRNQRTRDGKKYYNKTEK